MVEKRENIFLFVPNLIGYARIFLALVSCVYMASNYKVAALCYVVSGLLDAFDGYAARLLNQSTKFGGILDQITDRIGTLCLVICLSTFYPKYLVLFQLVCAIDIGGHWIHVWASLMQGRTSHKFIKADENPILSIYYTSRPVLFFMCATNELYFSSLYLLHFVEGPIVAGFNIGLIRLLVYASFPFAILKLLITILQMVIAAINVASIDQIERAQTQKSK